jgi:hypothetical protein
MINREWHGIGCCKLKVIPRNMPQDTEKITKKKKNSLTDLVSARDRDMVHL